MKLNDQIVIITGAGRGIGRATALLFAREGATCVLAARTESDIKKVAGEIEANGGKGLPVVCDVSKDADIDALIAKTIKTFGKIDVLVNNAGGGCRNDVKDARIEDWDWMIQVNLRGAMVCAKKTLPSMIKAKQGTIINIASIAGIHGYASSSGYCASKFGLRGFSESLFEEVRETGIKVSTICPGYVDTALIPNTRQIDRAKMIRAEDIANACLFVATSSPQCCPTEMVILPQKEPLL